MGTMLDFVRLNWLWNQHWCTIHIGSNVTIGKDCRIQGSVYIADGCTIGDEVFIGPNATLTNDRYPPSGGKWKPVIVQNKVVIGANSTIVAGAVLMQSA